MKLKDDGRLAFPRVLEHDHCWVTDPGMTLRQYAAIKIAAGLVVDGDWSNVEGWRENVAKNAVKLADLLITELDTESKELLAD